MANLRILISNDDGIDSPGIAVLEKVALCFSDDVWVVAPASNQSGVGQSISLQKELKFIKLRPHKIVVEGSPADCAILALHNFCSRGIDVFLSGVNEGHNLGLEVGRSGTVGAAIEAFRYNVRSIAFNQVLNDQEHSWGHTESVLKQILPKLLLGPLELLNVNIPPKEVYDPTKNLAWVPQSLYSSNFKVELKEFGVSGFGLIKRLRHNDLNTQDWAAINKGMVTVTPLSNDLTNYFLLKEKL